MVTIRTLGAARVGGVAPDDAPRLLAQPKRWALLAYLAVEATDSGLARDQVLGVFWPEHTQHHARGSLRNALHYLRSILGSDCIRSVGDHLVVPSEEVWCDAHALLRSADAPAALLDLYRGEFLDGVHVSGSPEFGYWVDRTRSALRARATSLAWTLADQAAASREWITAATMGRRAVSLAIDLEAASQRLMRLLDRAGDRAAAVAEFERLRGDLEATYGVGPSPESQALAAEIRSRARPSAALTTTAPEDREARPSLAVLPFRNLSGPDADYLAEGMTQDLLIALAPLRDVRIVSGISMSRPIGGAAHPSAELRERLQVELVLEGSIRTSRSRARVTASLVDVASNEQLWAEAYDGSLGDLFDVQSDVALRIARALKAELSPREHRRLRSPPTRSVEAYDRYLRARELWSRRTRGVLDEAIELFEAAVDIDPDFALGWVGLADARVMRAAMLPARADQDVERARRCLDRALTIDPDGGEAHASLGTLQLFFEGDVEGAMREYRRATALSPGYATAHHWLGNLLVADGRVEEGLDELSLALELDPLSPLVQENVALGLYHADQLEDALRRLRTTLDLHPDYWRAHWAVGLCLAGLDRFGEAVAAIVRAWEAGGHSATAGELREVREALDADEPQAALEAMLASRRTAPARDRTWRVVEAILWVMLERHESALQALARARDEGTLPFLIVYAPALDPLRDRPEMRELLDELGFTPGRWR